jgi:hypothetical protein
MNQPGHVLQHRCHPLSSDDQQAPGAAGADRQQFPYQGSGAERHGEPQRDDVRLVLADPRHQRARREVRAEEAHCEAGALKDVGDHPQTEHVVLAVSGDDDRRPLRPRRRTQQRRIQARKRLMA